MFRKFGETKKQNFYFGITKKQILAKVDKTNVWL